MNTLTSDWLGLETVFYHTLTGKTGRFIHEVIDYHQFEWDWEGLRLYLEWGFSVFGLTPIRNVRFLSPRATLIQLPDGTYGESIDYEGEEAFVHQTTIPTHPKLVIDVLSKSVNEWEKAQNDSILLPLSGGYDSRLLATLIKDKSKLASYSYGVSYHQEKSRETVRAKLVAERLGIQWQQIILGDFNAYFDRWNDLYAGTAGTSGSYVYEFYDLLAKQNVKGKPLLSGIVGDAWAGKFVVPINHPNDVYHMALTHGIHVNSQILQQKLPINNPVYESYFERKKHLLESPAYRVLELIRFKITFLNLLFRIPELYGHRPFSPFVLEDNVIAMLALPNEERINRKWQQDYFNQLNLDLEHEKLKFDKYNYLNHYSLIKQPVALLDVNLLKEIIQPSFLNDINNQVGKKPDSLFIFKIKQNILNFRNKLHKNTKPQVLLSAYWAYTILYPLQYLIQQRNQVIKGGIH